MKSSKILSFFVFLSILISIIVNSTSNYAESPSLNSDGELFSDYIDDQRNQSIYYIQIINEMVYLEVKCDSWGDSPDTTYKGLLVEIVNDTTSDILKSWLILKGDNIQHHFTSEESLSGVLQIRFTALNVNYILFNWEIDNNIPIWTYEILGTMINEVYIGLERSEDYYEYLEKIIAFSSIREWSKENYTIRILSESDVVLTTFTSNFSLDFTIVGTMEMDRGLEQNRWYKISLDYSEFTNESIVKCKFFYDHEQQENVIRLFLSTGAKSIQDIQLDHSHSGADYLWKKIEIPPPIDPPIDPPPFWLYIWYFFILLGVIIFVGLMIYSIRRALWNNKTKQHAQHMPSPKYWSQEPQSAIYEPVSDYNLQYNNSIPDYNLVTDARVQVQCAICLQTIVETEKLVRCPSCDIAFHKNHLFEWLKINGTCPACKAKLKIT